MIGRPVTPPTETSLLEILRERAQTAPDRSIFHFLEDGETETERFTYGDLDRRARAIAATLQTSLKPGDRAALLYPPGLEFIAALFGCFYAGAIAVPVAPPRTGFVLEPFTTLLGIIRDSDPAVLLSDGVIADLLAEAARTHAELATPPIILTREVDRQFADQYLPSSIQRETPALLQYTSGSTADPKGVLISQGNLLANSFVIQQAFQHRTAERMGGGVCWLPFHHDMGLIGSVLQAVYVDGPCWVMSPVALLQHPYRWLEVISRTGAHTSGGPNFAYDLCVRRITEEQKPSLDLSHWDVACIGAEPVSYEIMDRFAEAFAPCGFRREAFYPSYGLAEATLMVSGGDKHAPPVVRSFPRQALELRSGEVPPSAINQGNEQFLVGCGRAADEHELKIVDPETRRECPDGIVGEIWVRGPSVGQGYWGRGDETRATFQARLSGCDDGVCYLRTGDLGLLSDGELFVCGRLKELIVIRGHNHYPQDIEWTLLNLHSAFRPGGAVAIGCLVDGEEQLVILQEIERRVTSIYPTDLARLIRQQIAEVHQLQVFDLAFVRQGTLPKTTSGKFRRQEARRQYLSQQLVLWEARQPHD